MSSEGRHEKQKQQTIGKIVSYLIDENFPVSHLNALLTIIRLFNKSEASEEEVFVFAAELCNKYGMNARHRTWPESDEEFYSDQARREAIEAAEKGVWKRNE